MFKIEMKRLDSKLYSFEPGDGSHYEFIISETGGNMLVASTGAILFKGCEISTPSVAGVLNEFRALVTVPDGVYVRYATSSGILDNPFIKYVQEKANCNEFTALAAIICCLYFMLGDIKLAGVIEKVEKVVADG